MNPVLGLTLCGAALVAGAGCERCQALAPSPPPIASPAPPVAPPQASSGAPFVAQEPAVPGAGANAGSPVPAAPPIPDTGVFGDLDDQVRVQLPSWLSNRKAEVFALAQPQVRYVVVDGVAVGFANESMTTTFEASSVAPWDRDGDAIPDSLDILLGAKKTVLNGAAYRSTYRVLSYPGGDVPRTEGVCTDVVVRAFRNAGFDLQKGIHEDAKARPSAYPGIQKLDRSIDHRRVRNLLPYFTRYFLSLPVDPQDTKAPWLPGDVVFLDTMNDPQPEHLGIVSDQLGPSGFPLLINNWTDGTQTAEMDLLSFVPVRNRFRVPAGKLTAASD